ncbi:MAG: replication initiator protein A [Verrucomicrobiota bacterium]
MNLAEFPLSAIADRLDPSQKTLVFEDRVWDNARGEMVPRQLLITASEEYGLPTARDDEVILGLIQLSRMQGFADRKVAFTRYQLIQLLGWRHEGKSYQRIETSLNRWLGVTLYYKNAWRDRKNACWVDEKFHILDNVTLFDSDKRLRAAPGQTTLPISSFSWNEVVFKSFKDGNLRSLDFDFFCRLESAVSKRLYRFLDKRFFHRSRWEFNLQELCWEHVGLARSYDTSNLKRKLRPAIAELEQRGFIRPVGDAERFRRVSCGEWRVVFERAQKAESRRTEKRLLDESLCHALTSRGVTHSTAVDTVERYPAEQIQQRLEVFDWLLDRKDKRIGESPPGFLVSSIRGEYLPPRGFKSRAETADAEAKAQERALKEEARLERERILAERKLQARQEAITEYWGAMSPEERTRLEGEAIAQAGSFERSLLENGGSLAQATLRKVLEEYALRNLEGAL